MVQVIGTGRLARRQADHLVLKPAGAHERVQVLAVPAVALPVEVRHPRQVVGMDVVDVDVGARFQAAEQLLAGPGDEGVPVADQHGVEVEGQQLAALGRGRLRVGELLVRQQAQPSQGRAHHQVAGQDRLPLRPVEGDLALALAVLQVHGLQTGEDLLFPDGPVDARGQGCGVGLVGDHPGPGALPEGAGLALVVAVGHHDPGGPLPAGRAEPGRTRSSVPDRRGRSPPPAPTDGR